MVYAMVSIGVLGVYSLGTSICIRLVWMWIPGLILLSATMIIAVPTGIKVFSWLATIWGGFYSFTHANVICVGLFAVVYFGWFNRYCWLMLVWNVALHDTYYVVAHFHYVSFDGCCFCFVCWVVFIFGYIN